VMVVAVGLGTVAATVGAEPALSGNVGELVDRGGPPKVPAAGAAAASGATGGTDTPAAATVTVPPPPLKVLVVGDSQAATLAQGLNADGGHHGLSSQPGVVIWNRAILGCSISSAPVFVIDGERQNNKCGGVGFWQRQWAQDVVAFHPDAVVVMAGAWDIFDVAGPDGTILSPGQPAWTAAYDRDVAQLFDILRATGAPVVAIDPSCYGHNELPGTDPQAPERLDATRVSAVHQVWVDEARAHGASLAPLDGLLCPGGTSDPSIRPDGAHFGTAGADRAAPLVVQAVHDAVDASAAVSVLGAHTP
jgi:lysophospholipase L1-like esterase